MTAPHAPSPRSGGSATLLPRVLLATLVPLVPALGAVAVLVFVRTDPTGRAVAGGLLLVAVILAVALARRLDGRLREPVEQLARALDTGVAPSARSEPGWEIATLYPRVRAILAGGREAPAVEGEIAVMRDRLRRVCETLDRVGTDEPPGDAAHVDGILEPLGASLRALLERLDRREHELARLLDEVGESVGRMGEEAAGAAAGQEALFLDAVALGAALKELGQATEMVVKESERLNQTPDLDAAAARITGMGRRLTGELDRCLDAAGALAARLEADATRERRVGQRGSALRRDVTRARDRVTTVTAGRREEPVSAGPGPPGPAAPGTTPAEPA